MRIYEELFIITPEATDEQVDHTVEQLTSVITSGGGKVDKVDKWGKRRLAYTVKKFDEGIYILIQFSSDGDLVKELERRLRVMDLVIKFLTVRIDLDLKRLEKKKAKREKRAQRKATAAPAQAPGAPGPSSPGPGAPGPGAPVPGAPQADEQSEEAPVEAEG